MKNIVYILVCASVIFFTACSSQNKNKKDGTQVLMQDSTEIAGPQRMQVSDVKTSFTYKGKEYQSSVVRRPDESLPIVKNEQGEKKAERWMDSHAVCRKLRISPRTLQTLRDNGTLAFTKIGNRTYYRLEDVERVIVDVEERRKEAKWKGKSI